MQYPLVNQSEYDLGNIIAGTANDSGRETCQNIGKALLSVATDFSGSSDPATLSGIVILPGMRWQDTGNNILKIRNLENTGWINFMDLTTGNIFINGHATTDIFESDGKKVKAATLADAAKGDTRFQISGSVGGGPLISVGAGRDQMFQRVRVWVPVGKSVILKRVRYDNIDSSAFKLHIDNMIGNSWLSTDGYGDEIINYNLYTNDTNWPAFALIRLMWKNSTASTANLDPSAGCHLDVSIE